MLLKLQTYTIVLTEIIYTILKVSQMSQTILSNNARYGIEFKAAEKEGIGALSCLFN